MRNYTDYLRYRATRLEEFANPCHDPENGRFCETPGHPKATVRDISSEEYSDEDLEYERVQALNKHYGRPEMAPEMGGTVWAFEGESPGITEAAEDVLQGLPYDSDDVPREYFSTQYDIAETILKTIETETSDVALFSGHRRPRDQIDSILQEGVSFPLVATSPSNLLASQYAGKGTADTVSIVFEFPPGTQSGYYQANEHIATGEFEVESHAWSPNGNRINIKLRQTKRNTVPEKIELEEEE